MATTTIPPRSRGTFAQKLRAELDYRGMGVRTLARAIDANHIDRVRRRINKWLLEGTVPTRESRDAVTDVLGLERGSLDDDEEDRAVRAVRAHVEGIVGVLLAAAREAKT